MTGVRFRVLVAVGLETMEVPIVVPPGAKNKRVTSRALAVDIARGLRERGWDATAYRAIEDAQEIQ